MLICIHFLQLFLIQLTALPSSMLTMLWNISGGVCQHQSGASLPLKRNGALVTIPNSVVFLRN